MTTFNIYAYLSLDELLISMQDALTNNSDIVSPTVIIVPNDFTGIWLADYFTSSVFANYMFYTPTKFFQAIYNMNNKVHYLGNPPIYIHIYNYLSDVSNNLADYPEIELYLKNKSSNNILEFAIQLEKIFLEYMLLYPLALISGDVFNHSQLLWQKIIWQYIEHNCFSYINIFKYLFDASSLKMFSQIYIYGGDYLHYSELLLLKHLSKFTNIDWYKFSFSFYYYDFNILPNINLLVSTLVKNNIVQDLMKLNLEVTSNNNYHHPDYNNLLQLIQYDVNTLSCRVHNGDDCHPVSISIHNIELHKCSNKLREVQVLFNNIINDLSDTNKLDLGDIIVSAPNISEYSSYISDVFESEYILIDGVKQFIPYEISEYYIGKDDIVSLLIDIFSIDFYFTSDDLITLLYHQSLQNNLDLSSKTIELINTWLHDNKIKFGFDSKDYEYYGYHDYDNNTFLHFLNKIVLGLCIKKCHPFESYYDNLEFKDIVLCNSLIGVLLFLQQVRNLCFKSYYEYNMFYIDDVIKLLLEFNENFINSEDDSKQIKSTINKLKKLPLVNLLNRDMLCQILSRMLGKKVSYPYSGKVLFCSMQSINYLPYKNIYLIGINDSFPISGESTNGLLNTNFPILTNIKSADDKRLFLELLMATREKLYISYSSKEPSVLLTLLRRIITDSLVEDDSYNVVEHDNLAITHYLDNIHFSGFWNNIRSTFLIKNIQWDFTTEHSLSIDSEDKNISLDNVVRSYCSPNYSFMHSLGIYRSKRCLPNTDELVINNNHRYLNSMYKQYLQYLHNNDLIIITDFSINSLLQNPLFDKMYSAMYYNNDLAYDKIGQQQFSDLLTRYSEYIRQVSMLDKVQVSVELEGLLFTGSVYFKDDILQVPYNFPYSVFNNYLLVKAIVYAVFVGKKTAIIILPDNKYHLKINANLQEILSNMVQAYLLMERMPYYINCSKDIIKKVGTHQFVPNDLCSKPTDSKVGLFYYNYNDYQSCAFYHNTLKDISSLLSNIELTLYN